MKIFNLYFSGKRNKNQIALAFDDGPCEETLNVLKILKRYDSKATFFILGEKIRGNEKIVNHIIKQGHEIGNHSYSHLPLWFKDKKFIKKELIKTDNELLKLGVKTNLIRPPYFRFGLNFLKICNKLNKKIIFCSIDSKDWKLLNKKVIIKRILKKVKNGSIINMHDYLEDIGKNKQLLSVLEELIPQLNRKYKLVTISELLK